MHDHNSMFGLQELVVNEEEHLEPTLEASYILGLEMLRVLITKVKLCFDGTWLGNRVEELGKIIALELVF